MVDLNGKQLGAYKVEDLIGRGGMAAVYKAYHQATERNVAIKVMLPDVATNETFQRRFEREAKTLAGLQHVHILPVFDYGQQDGVNYLVMPFLPGRTLADHIRENDLTLAEIATIFRQLASALDYAHGKGILHRDLKPDNVMMDEDGNVLLADFGLTRLLNDAQETSKLTSDSTVIGTPAYMSPEQGQGRALDHRSDLYSLAVLLYEMLTGTVPYKAETPVAVIFKHISDPLPPPSQLRDGLPPDVDTVIATGMAKQADDRYDTATAMANAFDAAIAGEELPAHTQTTVANKPKYDGEMSTTQADALAVAEQQQGAVERHAETVTIESPGKRKHRAVHPRAVAIIALVVVLVAGGGVGYFVSSIAVSSSGLYRSPDWSMLAHDDQVLALDVSTTGDVLLTGGADNTLRAWAINAENGIDGEEPLIEVEGLGADVLSLDIHPQGTDFAVSGRDGNGLTWSVEEDMQVMTFLDGGRPLYRYSPDGRLLAMVNARSLSVLLLQDPEEAIARSQAFVEAGLVMDSMASLPVDLPNPSEASYTAVAFTPVTAVAQETAPDGRPITLYNLIVGDDQGNIYNYEITFEALYATPEEVGDDMRARLSDFERFDDYRYLGGSLVGQARQTEDNDEITAIAFNPDGTRFATADDEGLVVVWSTATFDQTRIFPGDEYEAVYDIAFSGSGGVLAIATEQTDVLLYDVERGEIIGELYTNGGDSTSVAFTPDDTLAVGAEDGLLYIWELDGELDTD